MTMVVVVCRQKNWKFLKTQNQKIMFEQEKDQGKEEDIHAHKHTWTRILFPESLFSMTNLNQTIEHIHAHIDKRLWKLFVFSLMATWPVYFFQKDAWNGKK